jgi:hypothetical protein
MYYVSLSVRKMLNFREERRGFPYFWPNFRLIGQVREVINRLKRYAFKQFQAVKEG